MDPQSSKQGQHFEFFYWIDDILDDSAHHILLKAVGTRYDIMQSQTRDWQQPTMAEGIQKVKGMVFSDLVLLEPSILD